MGQLPELFTSNMLFDKFVLTLEDIQITEENGIKQSVIEYDAFLNVTLSNGKPGSLIVPVRLHIKENASISDYVEHVTLKDITLLSGLNRVSLTEKAIDEFKTFIQLRGRTVLRLEYDDLMAIERKFASAISDFEQVKTVEELG